jgi:alkylhydroperoxidase family enzyme
VSDPLADLKRVVAETPPAPTEMAPYLEKVRDRAYSIVDRDVEALEDAGFSQDAIFEQTVAVAIAEGVRRLERAKEVIG